jgi:hypothetical protein
VDTSSGFATFSPPDAEKEIAPARKAGLDTSPGAIGQFVRRTSSGLRPR